jgi:hypothetical protein
MMLIAQNIIVFLGLVTGCIALFLFYLTLSAISGRGKSGSLIQPFQLLALFGCAGLFIAAAYQLVLRDMLGLSLSVLGGGFTLLAALYFVALRPGHIDERAKYAMMLWVSITLMSGIMLFLLWWFGEQFELPAKGEKFKIASADLMQLLAAAAQVLGIIIAAAMIVVTNSFNARQAERTSRQQIYQTLELQAVELFRYETGQRKLVGQLWVEGGAPSDTDASVIDSVSEYQLVQYVCQFLNLFEMAYRFRKDDVVDHEVFGSWVIWMWGLCERPVFRALWARPSDLRMNYVKDFRSVMDEGVALCARAQLALGQLGNTPADHALRLKLGEDALGEFFTFVATSLDDCPAVLAWLADRKSEAEEP